MNFDDLTPEQKERAKSCRTAEEMLALVHEEGVELSVEELDVVSGGWCPADGVDCPYESCGSFC